MKPTSTKNTKFLLALGLFIAFAGLFDIVSGQGAALGIVMIVAGLLVAIQNIYRLLRR